MIAKFAGNGLSAALLACIIAMPMQAKADDDKFDSPIVGSSPKTPIAGIPSGGAPWVVSRGQASLDSDGRLKVEVKGLLLGAAAGAAGGTTGGIPAVAASLVCGDVVEATTDPVPFPATGSFEIRAMVMLPSPACQGAVVLIRIVRPANTPPGAYIAVTGVPN
jgi:hypothetical protein